MEIKCYNKQDSLKIIPTRVQLLVEMLFAYKKIKTDEVLLHFVNKKTISKLHQDFFQDPRPTDCISFPIDRPQDSPVGHHVLGEVFVCPEVAVEYAQSHQRCAYDEVSLYIVHGLLHLLGYDDLLPAEEKIMREEEKRCMKFLKQQNAVLNEASES